MIGLQGSHPSRGEWIEIEPPPCKHKWQDFRLTPRGVSGLKSLENYHHRERCSLTPRGVSGLKSVATANVVFTVSSHPSRGEWIEIHRAYRTRHACTRLTPRGVSGLKFVRNALRGRDRRLTPRGVSGLKLGHKVVEIIRTEVSPLAG